MEKLNDDEQDASGKDSVYEEEAPKPARTQRRAKKDAARPVKRVKVQNTIIFSH